MLATVAIDMIGNWMQGVNLQIAHHKTEVLLISNCKVVQRAESTVGEHTIASKRVLKYLEVMIDDRLNLNSHVRRYGGAWVATLETKHNLRKLNSTYRLITISSEAVCIIAGMTPISITLAEKPEEHDNFRERSQWPSGNGNKTRRRTMNRKHGKVKFHLTQFLSGHGCFRNGIVDKTLKHVVFDCPRFKAVRREMPVLNVENVVDEKCREEGT
ncbi:uncharacterized protein LOC135715143 [Ochlerotatus camptorhynchus]|uniref:uncharacterized protein LOC135715143 n=1 Tax=Ochlerotatus camptorhynchus TaxID=644619 RepID=UPI0031E39480